MTNQKEAHNRIERLAPDKLAAVLKLLNQLGNGETAAGRESLPQTSIAAHQWGWRYVGTLPNGKAIVKAAEKQGSDLSE